MMSGLSLINLALPYVPDTTVHSRSWTGMAFPAPSGPQSLCIIQRRISTLWWRACKKPPPCWFERTKRKLSQLHKIIHEIKDKMTINEIQDELIADFSFFDDWMAKYEYIIQLAKELPLIDEHYKKDEYLIKGCQSKVWLHADYRDGKVIFTADSDAIITKGLVGLMVRMLANH